MKFNPGPHYIFYAIVFIAFIFTFYLLSTSSDNLKEKYRSGRRSYNPRGVYGMGSYYRPVNYYNVTRNIPSWRRWGTGGWGYTPYPLDYIRGWPGGGYWNEKRYLLCKDDCEKNYEEQEEIDDCKDDCENRYDPVF